MSRNFELLMQIEKDSGGSPPEANRRPEPAPISVPPQAFLDTSDDDHEYARLVQKVFFPATGVAHRNVVFCGIDASNGSSSVCARTARSLAAHTSQRICLLDANLSAAGLSSLLSIPGSPDGESVVSEQCPTGTGNLWLAKYEQNGNGGRLAGELQARVAGLQRDFRYVLIDAPGCALNDDAIVLGQLSDAAILVIEAETTHRLAARKAKQDLEDAGVCLAGTVLNNRSYSVPKALYKRL
jgi:Mrp family chromosome partitioning ATPase